jgi:hypothetical protein
MEAPVGPLPPVPSKLAMSPFLRSMRTITCAPYSTTPRI